MNYFTIQPESSWYTNPTTNKRQTGTFIKQPIHAFYHADYASSGQWKVQGTIENLIWTLKNDVSPFPAYLSTATQQLRNILTEDLPQILSRRRKSSLVICVVPRAKEISFYRQNQLLFKAVVSDVANNLYGFSDGTNYIVRHTNTRTTHLDKSGDGGNGDLPYPSITKNTCTISNEVKGKDILLIDDLYTKSINIDEDAIQALLDNGANSVILYTVGKTVQRN